MTSIYIKPISHLVKSFTGFHKFLLSVANSALFLSLFFSITLLSGCSDDYHIFNDFITDTKTDNSIYIYIPDAEVIKTRSNDNNSERYINNLSVLIYKDNNLIHKVDLDNETISTINSTINGTIRSCPIQLVLPEDINTSECDVYGVANTKISETVDLLDDYTVGGNHSSLDDLTNKVTTTFYDVNHGRIMSGKMVDSSIPLNRVSAKLSLRDGTGNDNFSLVDYDDAGGTTYGAYYIYYSASKCYMMAPLKNPSDKIEAGSNETSPIKAEKLMNEKGIRYDAYALPTRTHDDISIKTYVVIYATYEGEECYYAIPLYDSETDTFLDIEPNHWYDMTIKEVNVKGFPDAQTAIKNHNTNQITVEIHDHASKVFSMVSDGIHELGVTTPINLDSNKTSETLLVKCFAADTDVVNPDELSITIIEGKDWIIIDKNPQPVTPDSSEDYNYDHDNFGAQYEFTVYTEKAGNLYTDQTGIILVSYRGLSREVTVNYNSAFKPDEICDVVLHVKNYERFSSQKAGVWDEKDIDYHDDKYYTKEDFTIQDYWIFISGEGESTQIGSTGTNKSGTPRLFGISPDDLPDNRVRNEGFHFPMPYGHYNNYGSQNVSEYEYEIDFTELLNSNSNISKITPVIKDNSPTNNFISKYITIETRDDNKFILKMNTPSEADKYKYAIGKVTFFISYNTGDDEITPPDSELNFDIYHTGFFHFVDSSSVSILHNKPYYTNDNDYGFYYYAVPTLNGIPWLDRNIGAKASTRFGSRAEGNSIGSSEAGGKYFTVAKHDNYHAFFDEGMCPPGYRLPTSSEWNNIRQSNNFKTINRNINDEIYMSTFYDSGDNQIGDVFFQKGRYFNQHNSVDSYLSVDFDEANVGDDLSGYYWTRTVAPAMERENMGNWLRVLYFNGSSTSYVYGSIANHKYYVRCMADVESFEQTNYNVSFSVHNVTHVYLFAIEQSADGSSVVTPLYTFPGRAIGTTQSATIWQYFSTTTSIDTNKIYVVFTKLNENGTTTVFTKNGSSFNTENSTDFDTYLNETTAWYVPEIQGKYIDFCDDNSVSNIFDNEDAVKNSDCVNPPSTTPNPGPDNPGGGEGGKSETTDDYFKNGDQILFLWPKTIKGKEYPKFMAWYHTGQNNYIVGDDSWNGWNNEGSEGDNYKYTATLNTDLRAFTAGVFINSSDHIDIEIKYDDVNKYFYIEHPNGKGTYGGEITLPDRANGGKTWTIQLYDYDGIEGGNQGGGNIPGKTYPYNPDIKSEQIIWEGSHDLGGWNPMQDLAYNYDWSQIPVNSKIRFYCYPTQQVDWWCLSVRKVSKQEEQIDGNSQLNNPDGTYDYDLTQDRLDIIKNEKGLVIQGYLTIITKITIIPSN